MRLSRSKVDLFIQCPLCFWLDQKSKVKRPSGPPFSLNIAVDHLLKNEFDESRGKDIPERLARENLSFVPTNHPLLSRWRENFKGVTRQYRGIEFFGAIDDLWHDMFGVHYVVDYKATSKADEVSLDADWQIAYKRQVEFYQWLLRGNDLEVSNQAWFVYANGIKGDSSFDDQLVFKTKLLSYDGDASWIEPTLDRLIECLASSFAPEASHDCDYCNYVHKRMAAKALPQKVDVLSPALNKPAVSMTLHRLVKGPADLDAIMTVLQAHQGRLLIDVLSKNVSLNLGKSRLTEAGKRRILESIYALQSQGKIRLENGMAILVKSI